MQLLSNSIKHLMCFHLIKKSITVFFIVFLGPFFFFLDYGPALLRSIDINFRSYIQLKFCSYGKLGMR